MSAELQIESSILSSIAVHSVEAKLRVSRFPAAIIKRIRIASAPIAMARTHAAVRLQVPLEVLPASSGRAAEKPPNEESEVLGTITAILELATTGVLVNLRCVDIDLGSIELALGTDARRVKDSVIASIGNLFASDLGEVFQKIGVAIPRFSRVDLVGNVVAVRFEPAGAATARLPAGQEWGLFLDAAAVERLAKSKLPADFTSHTTSLTIEARWQPDRGIPHVDLYYSCKAPQVGEPLMGDVSGTIGCDFSLTATENKLLRSTVRWSLDIKLGALVPQFVNDIVKDAITRFMDPARFGGIPVDEHTYIRENELPDISFGGVSLEHRTLVASANGMTFGGPVKTPYSFGVNFEQNGSLDVMVSCTCASETSGLCRHCRAHVNQVSPDQVKMNGELPAEKTTWEREILTKLLGPLRMAESWAASALPGRDFITLAANPSSVPSHLRDFPHCASAPSTNDAPLLPS